MALRITIPATNREDDDALGYLDTRIRSSVARLDAFTSASVGYQVMFLFLHANYNNIYIYILMSWSNKRP
ncbi:hypothetical protein Hanom_Chr06g00575571 [Helianthus anomalus]